MKYVSRVNQVIKEINAKAAEARIETAEEIGKEAQANAPVRTGELRDSLKVEHLENVSHVGFTAEHGIYVELGTARMAAQPFLIPAAHRGEGVLKEKLVGKLKSIK
jgi:HK97 gp10 family phage protein